MSDSRPRTDHTGRQGTSARHGRLRTRGPWGLAGKIAAAVVGVVLVSTASIAAFAALNIIGGTKPPVALIDKNGNTVTPQVGAMNGAFNVLLAGSDSGGGDAKYGQRGESLNDVTMVLHVSADHKNATVISFPRDTYVPIPSCPDPKGGSFSAMSRQKINTSLSYGGMACTVLTVEQLTGLSIPYAATIEFDGVVAMSDAVGGVPVCLAGRLDDDQVNPPLHLAAGRYNLKGGMALSYLRTRHSIGDGSDLGRISNQQSFLSSLMRTIKSGKTLADPVKLYAIATAATHHMTLSQSLSGIQTMVSMAAALKNIDLNRVVFVQYPNHVVGDGVEPNADDAARLMAAVKSDKPITLTGTTGVGTEVTASGSTSSPKPTGGSAPKASTAPATDPASVLPNTVHGQTAAQTTCAKPFQG
jgi:cell envelope-related function transcriptional attenuator common domain